MGHAIKVKPFYFYTNEVRMLENLVSFYRTSDGRTKKKILGCIFSEKLVLEKGSLQPPHFPKGYSYYMTLSMSYKGLKKKRRSLNLNDLIQIDSIPGSFSPHPGFP